MVDLEQETLSAGVTRLTDGAGADVVLDGLGGDLTGPALGTLKRGGVLVSIGYTAGTKAAIDVTDLIWKTARMEGFLFAAFTQEELADAYRTLLGHLAVHTRDRPRLSAGPSRRGPKARRRRPASRESIPRSPNLSPPHHRAQRRHVTPQD
ncbi:zinc-binding dehydrogenase [Actinomadura meridiana]|uniref:zinc-binding dehydrogenase n=1 Tax=Actinomadura meridiana TaxID=559626 RepID=UPI0031EB9FAE